MYNDEHLGMDEKHVEMHEQATKIKTINRIEFGKYSCDTWYYSPYPEKFHNIDTLYICEYCLNFYLHVEELQRHS